MKNQVYESAFRCWLWVVSLLVPRSRRLEWRQEWWAEVAAQQVHVERWGQSQRRTASAVLGALPDAVWLRFDSISQGFYLDLRLALRDLARRPLQSVFIIVILALGIAASTTLFAAVDVALLRPLPFANDHQLVRLWEVRADDPGTKAGVASGNLVTWRRENQTLSGVAGWYVSPRTIRAFQDGQAEVVAAAQVTTDFFPVFGVEALHGRTFTEAETDRAVYSTSNSHRGVDPVVVLGHAFWQRTFGGNPEVIGSTVLIDRQDWRIVGVMPPTFRFSGQESDVYTPWSMVGERPHDQRYLEAVARLRPGIDREVGERDLGVIARGLAEARPQSNAGWGVQITSFRAELIAASRDALLLALGGVLIVLLVAALNASGIQLIRTGERQRDAALRGALGASRFRLLRQYLIESLLPVSIAGAIGLGLASAAMTFLGHLPLPRAPELDLRVVMFAIVATLAAGAICALPPAWRGTAKSEASGLGARHRIGSRREKRTSEMLVVAEIALATLLVASAAILAKSVDNLRRVEPGFQPDGVWVMPINLELDAYGGGGARGYYSELVSRLENLPGVEAAGAATVLPMAPLGPDFARPVWSSERQPGPERMASTADIRMATPGYFDTVGIEVVDGRRFDSRDDSDHARVVIVSEGLAKRTWPHESAVGKQLTIDYSRSGTYPYEVVGVVADVRFGGLRATPRPELYLPHAQRPYLMMNVVVRSSRPSAAIVPHLQRALHELDPLQPAHTIVPLTEHVAASIAKERLTSSLVTWFAAAGLLLAVVGLYGLLAVAVHRQRSEIAVRMALGAHSGNLRRWILKASARRVALGVAIGYFLVFASTRFLESLLFGVGIFDAPSVLIATALVGSAALIASWIPARQACRTNPAAALSVG